MSMTDLAPGAVLRGKYELIQKLGAGGMGAVYKARHLAFGELKAIKVIGHHLTENETFLGRFRSEAVLARRLQHPNIVRVDDLDTTEDGHPFIVMEYVEGESLRSVIRKTGPLGPRRAVDIAAQTCAALAAAHGLGILHRDIKPDNVVLITGADGREVAKVLDFGLAKVIEGFEGSSEQVATATGMMLGTPHYMAPEQAMGRKAGPADGRLDLYALGVVMYEMVTGRVPFDSDTPVGVVLQHIQAVPVPPHEAYPELKIPLQLSTVILKAMEKEPSRRYANAQEMHAALLVLAGRLPADNPALFVTGTVAALPRTANMLPASPTSSEAPTMPGKLRAEAPTVPGVNRERPTLRPRPGPTARVSSPALAMTEDEPSSGMGLWGWLIAGVLLLGAFALYRSQKAPASPPAASSEASPASASAPVEAAPRPASGGGSQNADDMARAEVQKIFFFSAPLRDARIEVAVTNGIVTLTGQAPNATARDLATSLAATVPGVRRVFTTVEIPREAASAPATPSPAPTVASVATPPPTAPPAPEEPPQGAKVRELLEKARDEIERGNHDAAAKIFEEVLRLDPQNPRAREALERFRSGRRPPPPR
jgi:serine/threonine-protein kinase